MKTDSSSARVPQPYPGIRPFDEGDWPIFFGRDDETNELLHKLETNRFVAVVGSSGSGKSSLVRAGLIRLLRQGFLRDVTDWAILILRPGNHPFGALAAQIIRRQKALPDAAELPPATQVEAGLLAAELQASDAGLAHALAEFSWSEQTHFLVVVDQFEELFGFRSASQHQGATRDVAERFVGLLLKSSCTPVAPPFGTQPGSPPAEAPRSAMHSLAERVWVITTMRSDFIGDCEVFPELARAVSCSQFLVPVLTASQKEEAIARPGATKYIEGADYAPFHVEPALVTIIVNESGDRLDQLPLMQHALMRTWQLALRQPSETTDPVTLTVPDYDLAGRIKNALHKHAESAWEEIRKNERLVPIARTLFLSLCDLSGEGKLTRRRPRVSEVEALSGASLSEIEQVVSLFQQENRNFLLPTVWPLSQHHLAREDTLDISHEALLRQWSTYEEWQAAEKRRVDELLRLRDQARLYQQNNESPLSGRALDRVNSWRSTATWGWASRYVSCDEWDAVVCFIENSRLETKRWEEEEAEAHQAATLREAAQRRRVRRVSIAFAAAATILSLGAAWFVYQATVASRAAKVAAHEASASKREAVALKLRADQAVEKAEQQQTLGFTRIIGSSEAGSLSKGECDVLWELAELAPASEPIRLKLLPAWFQDPASFARAFGSNGWGIAAAMGLSPARRGVVGKLAAPLAVAKTAKAAEPFEGAEPWIGIAGWLDSGAARQCALNMSARLEIDVLKPERSDDLQRYSSILLAMAKRLPSSEADELIERGAQVCTNALQLPASATRAKVASALQRLANRLPPRSAGSIGEQLVKRMEGLAETEEDTLWEISSLLPPLLARMEPKDASDLAQRGAVVVIRSLEKTPPPNASRIQYRPLNVALRLTPLMTRMESRQAQSAAARVAALLLSRLETYDATKKYSPATPGGQLFSLTWALAEIFPHLAPEEAAAVGERSATTALKILEDKTNSGFGDRDCFVLLLARIAPRMDPTRATTVVSRTVGLLTEALESPASAYERTDKYAPAIRSLLPMLSSSEAHKLILVIVEHPEKAVLEAKDAEAILGGLAAKTEPFALVDLAGKLETDLEAPEGPVGGLRLRTAGALAIILPHLKAEAADAIAARVAAALLAGVRAPNDYLDLTEIILPIIRRLPPEQATRVSFDLALLVLKNYDADSANFDFDSSLFGRRLLHVSRACPRLAVGLRRLALANLFVLDDGLSEEDSAEAGINSPTTREAVLTTCDSFTIQQLADMLKWPFCVGTAQDLVLETLEKKTGHKFGGDKWKFVALAPSLDVDLESPTRRPTAKEALAELEQLRKTTSAHN